MWILLAAGLAGGGLTAAICAGAPIPRWRAERVLLGALAVKGTAAYAAWGVLGAPLPADLPGFAYHARLVLDGALPNRDFLTPYGFFFPYACAAALRAGGHPAAIAVAFQIAETAGVLSLVRALESPLGGEDGVRKFVWLWLVNPLALVLWLDSQDESLLILAVGVSVLAAERGRPFVGASWAALALHLSKLFTGWMTLPLLMLGRVRHLATYGALAGVVVMAFVAAGARPFSFAFTFPDGVQPLGRLVTTGNPWFAISRIFPGLAVGPAPAVAALAGLVAASVLLFRRRRDLGPATFVTIGAAAMMSVYLVAYKMTFRSYAATIVPAMLLLSIRDGRRWMPAWLAAWGTLYIMSSSLLFRSQSVPGRLMGDLLAVFDLPVVVGSCLVLVSLFRAVAPGDLRRPRRRRHRNTTT